MNRNESALQDIVNQFNTCLKQDEDVRWIVDIVSIWDFAANDWLGRLPLLFRTEGFDVTFWSQDGTKLCAFMEFVDTSNKESLQQFLPQTSLTASDEASARLYGWRTNEIASILLGSKLDQIEIVEEKSKDNILFTFDNGTSLQLSASGTVILTMS